MRKVILLIEASSSYARGLLQGILEYSRLNGPWTFYREPIAPFYRDQDRKFHFDRMKKWGADGIITRQPANLRDLSALHLPTIATDDDQQNSTGPCIISDYGAIGAMAAEHLLERGFKNFAYCGFNHMYWSVERGRSFHHHLKKSGFEVHFYEYPRSKTQQRWENESALLKEWLKTLPKPVGIMACNDDRGQQVIEACKSAGFYVPEETAVVGVDNDTLLCGLSNPTLSSVSINTIRAGYEAAQLLDDLMKGAKPPHMVITARPTHIVTRQSTDTLATEDRLVMKAVHFIRQNAKKSIKVTYVAQKVGISRRSLLDRFRAVLGRTVQEEIRRVRIERICEMLLETDLPVCQIALRLDFTSIEHISRYFQQEKGISPLAYRKQYSNSIYLKKPVMPDIP